jgi:hypothetical protein
MPTTKEIEAMKKGHKEARPSSKEMDAGAEVAPFFDHNSSSRR